jgi:hypothetical protein
MRWRFRRAGFSVSLKGRPGDPEFEHAYKAARDGIGHPQHRQLWLREGVIYVVQGEPGSPVKIGFTQYADVSKRLSALQTGSVAVLRIIAQTPAYRQHERIIHAALAGDRLHGEWFSWSPAIRAFVEALSVGIVAALDKILPHKSHGEPGTGEPLANAPLSD